MKVFLITNGKLTRTNGCLKIVCVCVYIYIYIYIYIYTHTHSLIVRFMNIGAIGKCDYRPLAVKETGIHF